jgi:hypothetical protein
MPRLALAFLGLTVGGSAFLASGLAGFLTITSFQDHVLLREAPTLPKRLQGALGLKGTQWFLFAGDFKSPRHVSVHNAL